MVRTSITRVIWTTAGMAALVGLLALGAGGQLGTAFNALAAAGGQADYVDNGVRIVPPSATSLSPDDNAGDEGDGSSRTDLEGDEVSPALATYGIDREGNLFEVHSPHTEVPRLAGPTT